MEGYKIILCRYVVYTYILDMIWGIMIQLSSWCTSLNSISSRVWDWNQYLPLQQWCYIRNNNLPDHKVNFCPPKSAWCLPPWCPSHFRMHWRVCILSVIHYYISVRFVSIILSFRRGSLKVVHLCIYYHTDGWFIHFNFLISVIVG